MYPEMTLPFSVLSIHFDISINMIGPTHLHLWLVHTRRILMRVVNNGGACSWLLKSEHYAGRCCLLIFTLKCRYGAQPITGRRNLSHLWKFYTKSSVRSTNDPTHTRGHWPEQNVNKTTHGENWVTYIITEQNKHRLHEKTARTDLRIVPDDSVVLILTGYGAQAGDNYFGCLNLCKIDMWIERTHPASMGVAILLWGTVGYIQDGASRQDGLARAGKLFAFFAVTSCCTSPRGVGKCMSVNIVYTVQVW